jgi:hypothetical protein
MSTARLLPLLLLLAVPALAEEAASPPSLTLPGRLETFGGVLMPAVMPQGATSLYAFVGAPEVGTGYRQGFSSFELEARARFDYLRVAFTGEVAVRLPVYARGRFDVALRLGLGGGWSSGTEYVDPRNFRGPFVHGNPGAIAAYRLHDTLRLFAQAEVPLDIGVQPVGGYRVTPLVGGGLEYYLNEEFSVMGSGEVGVDVLRAQLGALAPRVGYSAKVGLGVRLF